MRWEIDRGRMNHVGRCFLEHHELKFDVGAVPYPRPYLSS